MVGPKVKKAKDDDDDEDETDLLTSNPIQRVPERRIVHDVLAKVTGRISGQQIQDALKYKSLLELLPGGDRTAICGTGADGRANLGHAELKDFMSSMVLAQYGLVH